MSCIRWASSLVVLSVCVTAITGCGDSGPELGTVSGKVTLNGQPLPEATVEFIPDQGRSSSAVTDANGEYQLRYTSDRMGAVIGKHTVRITTAQAGFEPEGGVGERREAREERVPPKYNSASELTREVEADSNTFDFELESDGGTYPGLEEGAKVAPIEA